MLGVIWRLREFTNVFFNFHSYEVFYYFEIIDSSSLTMAIIWKLFESKKSVIESLIKARKRCQVQHPRASAVNYFINFTLWDIIWQCCNREHFIRSCIVDLFEKNSNRRMSRCWYPFCGDGSRSNTWKKLIAIHACNPFLSYCAYFTISWHLFTIQFRTESQSRIEHGSLRYRRKNKRFSSFNIYNEYLEGGKATTFIIRSCRALTWKIQTQ